MSENQIKVDETDEVKDVKLSHKEKVTLRRQQKKLKKFGVVDESQLHGLELFI